MKLLFIIFWYMIVQYILHNHDFMEAECNDHSINMPSLECREGTVLYGWAIGGNDIYLPKIGGISLSGNSDTHYILMEIHYDANYTFNNIYKFKPNEDIRACIICVIFVYCWIWFRSKIAYNI